MTSNDKRAERSQKEKDRTLVGQQSNDRDNSTPQSQQGQLTPYQGQLVNRNYTGYPAAPSEAPSDKANNSNSHKAHQNAEAIVRYSKNSKGIIREGKQAAAVDQIHQNNLHNIESVSDVPQSNDKYAPGNGLVAVQPISFKNNVNNKPAKPERIMGGQPQIAYSKDSDLITSFDPMKDRHTWTMWRTAVNGRIVDEVRRLEDSKKQKPSAKTDSNPSGLYGTALVTPPLRQFIRIDNEESKAIAAQLSSIGNRSLLLPQFVYYGIPRVRVSQPRK